MYSISKASKQRHVRRGVKEVVKSMRKGEKGYVVRLSGLHSSNLTLLSYKHRLLVLAADITPIDIISHLPVLSEEAQVPYVFVPSKEELGHAASTKRPTSCVMICTNTKTNKKVKDTDTGKETE